MSAVALDLDGALGDTRSLWQAWLEDATRFLDSAVGQRSSRALRHALLVNGAAAVRTIEANSHLKYRVLRS